MNLECELLILDGDKTDILIEFILPSYLLSPITER